MPEIWSRQHRLDIVAIGASTGGVEAIGSLVELLPRDLAAAVLVVLHRPPERISRLNQILSQRTELQIAIPHHTEPLQHGVCYIGHPDRHLTVGPGVRLLPLPNSFYRGHNIDALFCSLARHAGPRTIGVVLSGLLKDGTLGLKAIREMGGVALVQSPDEAEYPQMPLNARTRRRYRPGCPDQRSGGGDLSPGRYATAGAPDLR